MLASEATRYRCVHKFILMQKAESHSLHLEHVRFLIILKLSCCSNGVASSVGLLQGVVISDGCLANHLTGARCPCALQDATISWLNPVLPMSIYVA